MRMYSPCRSTLLTAHGIARLGIRGVLRCAILRFWSPEKVLLISERDSEPQSPFMFTEKVSSGIRALRNAVRMICAECFIPAGKQEYPDACVEAADSAVFAPFCRFSARAQGRLLCRISSGRYSKCILSQTIHFPPQIKPSSSKISMISSGGFHRDSSGVLHHVSG